MPCILGIELLDQDQYLFGTAGSVVFLQWLELRMVIIWPLKLPTLDLDHFKGYEQHTNNIHGVTGLIR